MSVTILACGAPHYLHGQVLAVQDGSELKTATPLAHGQIVAPRKVNYDSKSWRRTLGNPSMEVQCAYHLRDQTGSLAADLGLTAAHW